MPRIDADRGPTALRRGPCRLRPRPARATAQRVYEVLGRALRPRPGTSVVEVGPGTGQATRRLLELGADPLVVVEPNPSLAGYLDGGTETALQLVEAQLEEADLEPRRFDLAAAASSFHWVDEQVGLARLFTALRPGGWCAIWWTLFGDGGRARTLHRRDVASPRRPRHEPDEG